MTLENVIKMQCRDTAHAIGLLDRGTLEVGMKADLNVIDWESLKINMPYYTDDLPAGAPRWMQVRETVFLSHLCIKTIILPRQARDKHRESTQNRPFSRRPFLVSSARW